jgi:cation:H+ antiporter
MALPILAIVVGLAILLWSADRFVEGSAATARHYGMPSLLIGMIVVGFGTSAQGNSGIALGNAYGSNIANIALILGLTAMISPIAVHSQVLRKELPILTAITILAFFQIHDGELTRSDAWILLAVFAILCTWTIWQGFKGQRDALGREMEQELKARAMPLGRAFFWMILGLVTLLVSSRILVWGAVEMARLLGISDLVVGLTVVAVGTSLPELASSIMAIRKNEHDIALGNIVGSNLFNTLAVAGIAGAIRPMSVATDVITRDMTAMGALTLSLFVFGYGFRGPGRINRIEGAVLFASYVAYVGLLAMATMSNST